MFHNFMRWFFVAMLALLTTGGGSVLAVDILDGGVPNSLFDGLELWLDAGDLDGNGIADSFIEGSDVWLWYDKSGGGYVLEGGGTGTSPTIDTASSINNMPVVTMDQITMSTIYYSDLDPGDDPWYIFAVGASYSTDKDDCMWIRQGNGYSAAAGWSVMAGINGAVVRMNDGTVRASQTSGGLAVGEFGLVTSVLSGTGATQPTITGRLNGVTEGWTNGGCGPTDNIYNDAVVATDGLVMGRDHSKNQVAEILAYRGPLGDQDILDIEGYLRQKYAFSDPSEQPAPPEVIYSEIFPNHLGEDVNSNPEVDSSFTGLQIGWYANKGAGEVASNVTVAYPQGAPLVIVPVNSNPMSEETSRGYVWVGEDNPSAGTDYFFWTDEYAIDRDAWELDSVSWFSNFTLGETPTNQRVAFQVDGQWYVSDQVFNQEAATWELKNFDPEETTWTELSFTPDVELEMDTLNTGLTLPDGDIDAFGLYVDGLYETRFRFDIFKIVASEKSGEPSQPGDANGDGKVDGSDVTILAGNWQKGVSDGLTAKWEEGDFNGDGKVDGSDVTILAGNWQYGVNAAAASVPEPSVLVLLFGMMLVGWMIRKSR